MNITDATMSELADELNKCDTALMLGVQVRFFKKYRKFVAAEIDRRCPIDQKLAAMSDADLLSQLVSNP